MNAHGDDQIGIQGGNTEDKSYQENRGIKGLPRTITNLLQGIVEVVTQTAMTTENPSNDMVEKC